MKKLAAFPRGRPELFRALNRLQERPVLALSLNLRLAHNSGYHGREHSFFRRDLQLRRNSDNMC